MKKRSLSEYKLWYRKEAPFVNEFSEKVDFYKTGITNKDTWKNQRQDGWESYSTPLGNGYLGACVFGRVKTERIQLTDKTFGNRYGSMNCGRGFGAVSLGGLQSFGDIYMDFGHSFDNVKNYDRKLDMSTGVATTTYEYKGVTYKREYFLSYPDNVLAIRLTASKPASVNFTLRPSIAFVGHVVNEYKGEYIDDEAERTATLTANITDPKAKRGTTNTDGVIDATAHMQFYDNTGVMKCKVIPEGSKAVMWAKNDKNAQQKPDEGKLSFDKSGATIEVSDANAVTVLVAVATDHEIAKELYFEQEHAEKINALRKAGKFIGASVKAERIMENALTKSYKELKARHIADHSALFGRVNINLGGYSSLTTDELVESHHKATGANGRYTLADKKRDLWLEELVFVYGRYLLIASSRKGALPAHLQGAWTRYKYSPWGCAYWLNINVEMNYWAAFSANLAETFAPLSDHLDAYLPALEKMTDDFVRENFPENYEKGGYNGWGITNAYPFTCGIKQSFGNHAFFLSMFWDEYAFSERDPKKLERVYNLLVGAMSFMVKAVKKNDKGVYLCTHGDSPEQFRSRVITEDMHGKDTWYHTEGPIYQQAGIAYCARKTLEAARLLGKTEKDTPVLKIIKEQIDHYDEVPVGYSGQVKEFQEEYFYGDVGERQHRHLSHLISIYPCDVINESTPHWLDAAEVSIKNRGNCMGTWAAVHRALVWARLKRAEKAYDQLSVCLDILSYNLWCLYPVFQVEGNLGYTAAVAEMLLQSHENYIEPLASLSKEWSSGEYSGLVARGGYLVGAKWTDCVADEITITAPASYTDTCRVKLSNSDNVSVTVDGNAVAFTKEANGVISFVADAGKTYTIVGMKAKETMPAPEGFNVFAKWYDEIVFEWCPVRDAAFYRLYVAEESSPTYTLVEDNIGAKEPDFTSAGMQATFKAKSFADAKTVRRTFRVTAVRADGLESEGAVYHIIPTPVPEK